MLLLLFLTLFTTIALPLIVLIVSSDERPRAAVPMRFAGVRPARVTKSAPQQLPRPPTA